MWRWRWGQVRAADSDQRVLAAVGMLRPQYATLMNIARLAFVSAPRTVLALGRLGEAGKVIQVRTGGQFRYATPPPPAGPDRTPE